MIPTASRLGFSLLEMMIVIVILAAVVMMSTTAFETGSKLTERMTVENDLQSKANRVLNKLALELRTVNSTHGKLLVGTEHETAAGATYRYHVADSIIPTTYTEMVDGVPEPHESFTTRYEDEYNAWHELVYVKNDGSGTGRLTKRHWRHFPADATPTMLWEEMLCDQIRITGATQTNRGGFFIDQVGNTLSMELVLEQRYRAGTPNEMIVHVADAQVLFLRSTLNTNTGACPYNSQDEAQILASDVYRPVPQIIMGHRLTWASTSSDPEEQITITIQPPIGYSLNLNMIDVWIAGVVQTGLDTSKDPDEALYTPQWRYLPKAVNGVLQPQSYNFTGNAYQPAATYYTQVSRRDRPSTNGNYTITVQGQIIGPVTVWCSAYLTTGNGTYLQKYF